MLKGLVIASGIVVVILSFAAENEVNALPAPVPAPYPCGWPKKSCGCQKPKFKPCGCQLYKPCGCQGPPKKSCGCPKNKPCGCGSFYDKKKKFF